MEVADGFVQDARTPPSRRLSGGIGQIASGDPNPQAIFIAILTHPKVGHGSAAAGNSDGRRVRGVGGKSLRSSAAGNSLSDRLDVYGVGAGEQGRKRDHLSVRLIGVEKISVDIPRVMRVVIAGGSEGFVSWSGGGGTAKDPEGLVGGVVLAGIDVNDHLRLGVVPPRKGRRRPLRKRNFVS